jgi:hypothetical protein
MAGTSDHPFILSASRRTDVPAFYAEWFMERLRRAYTEYVHPYSHERIAVPLGPERVAAIVFWTKNFAPLFKRVPELERLGYSRWLVHYTITGLGREWEPRAPDAGESVNTLKALSARIGPERIYWRFDPMVFTRRTTPARTLERFAGLCRALTGSVKRCYVSVMQPYAKTAERVAGYEREQGDAVGAPGDAELFELSSRMAAVGAECGITIHACCDSRLAGFGMAPARCIDADLIRSLWPECGVPAEAAATRKGCNCHRALDIGAYDTCPHRCLYCYANSHDSLIARRHATHRPDLPGLVP